MNITKINYSQLIGKPGEWHLRDVQLGKLNLITGRNAVGKTRTVNILNSFANKMAERTQRLADGNWDMTFENSGKVFRYILRINEGKIEKERIDENGVVLLDRRGESGKIKKLDGKTMVTESFHPPINKLTSQVRRDVKQYPFIEDLMHWGENYHSFTFSNINPTQYSMPPNMRPGGTVFEGTSGILGDLSMVPYLLKEISSDVTIMKKIVKDLKKVGYEVENINTGQFGPAMGAASIIVNERNVNFPIQQQDLSKGMYRVIAIIIAVNYLKKKAKEGTIVIDDFCEGLDFSRASSFASIVFKEAKKENMQLIFTTNDMFLMNSVDLECWNIFERRGKRVKSINYYNNKEAFDEFKLIGMNNFDFFANRLYKGLKKDE